MTTIHHLETVRLQSPEVVKAPPLAVAKALTLIVLAVAFIIAGIAAGVVLLAVAPPAPNVVVQPTSVPA